MLDVIRELARRGQAIWYDGLKRDLLRTGRLADLVEDGVRGLTTNPSIYEQAIAETRDYDADLAALAARGFDAKASYEAVAVQDLRSAADVLRSVWDATDGRDGFVSLEVSPLLSGDTDGTVAEARRLWRALDRPNAFIKVPGTPAGIPAIERLAAEGVNVNVTLLFSRAAYRAAADAWIAGLEARARRGERLGHAASVASFFVSRVDTAVDRRLDAESAGTSDAARRARLQSLRGAAGISNAKLAYQDFRALVATERWRRLEERGARPQRVLFASTGVKDPRYPALYYVEALVGPRTVDTVPPATFEALRGGANIRATLEEDVDGARARLDALEELGISMDAVTTELLAEGVEKFAEPFGKLLRTVEERWARLSAEAAH